MKNFYLNSDELQLLQKNKIRERLIFVLGSAFLGFYPPIFRNAFVLGSAFKSKPCLVRYLSLGSLFSQEPVNPFMTELD